MPAAFFRALAIDYDGTLTTRRRPAPEVLSAIAETRDSGITVLLVTGRILVELREDFPEVDAHFDGIIAENGAVLSFDGEDRPLAPALEPAFLEALEARGIPARAGRVIVATEADYDRDVMEQIARFGLEHQLVRNRGALMVLPHGVSKGSGTAIALAELGISCHNAIGVGDAENDHSLLAACEIGVAVANAVQSLRDEADLVLDEPAGAGVLELLRRHLPARLRGVQPRRRRVLLGRTKEGIDVSIPATRINMAIYGASGQGKSYVAGLVAESLVAAGYVLCVLDLEGDHAGLAELPGVVVLGGAGPLPTSDELRELLRHGPISVVIDLAQQSLDTKHRYGLAVIEQCQMMQDVTGLPHWIMVEEAHIPLASHSAGCGVLAEPRTGLCLVSYHPDQICHHAAARTDARIVMADDGQAELWNGSAPPVRFTPRQRRVPHARHTRKYMSGRLPRERRFYFRTPAGMNDRVAANLPEFRDEIERAPPDVLLHHAARGDFSRWLGDLSYDRVLREEVRRLERSVGGTPARHTDVAAFREKLAEAIDLRYPE
ncbi:MAG TPA: HAD hydrolase family protein [Gemmatimonadaceae bacterium]|nr:HAD hydrolase family protein [Gemmatimonadaceae bacterium]